jgi:hypothetical protein
MGIQFGQSVHAPYHRGLPPVQPTKPDRQIPK